VLCGLEFPKDPNLIVGLDRPDDAGVYKITDDLALIQTVDFFTPIVDDPYWFGQIAVANALSDIYAMAGIPKTAMNLVAFPINEMDISVLRRILQGGTDKMREADVVLVGGHSVEDKELKYGLAVTGFIHPQRILTKRTLLTGDRLILTKPLGTGIINTAIKAGLASQETINAVIRLMAALNRGAADTMKDYPVRACTDITGFGLLGHLAEMVEASEVGLSLMSENIPIVPEALKFAEMGLIPAGAYKNRDYRAHMVDFAPSVDSLIRDILFDPQTSGGLLMCMPAAHAHHLLNQLRGRGVREPAIIGEVIPDPKERILVL
jgi:selenide,water dikinase